jgi:hypothetical protein
VLCPLPAHLSRVMEGRSAAAVPALSRVEMSLDDCIKSRKKASPPPPKKTPPPVKAPVPKKKPAKGKVPTLRPGTPAASPAPAPTPAAAGGVGKKRNRGNRKASGAATTAAAAVTEARGGPSGGIVATGAVAGGLKTKRGAARAAAKAASSSKAGCRIAVSNLNDDVSEEDIKELFGAVGPLVSSKLLTNGEARSARRAEVIFVQMAHALEAIKRYNGVPLDDRPLKITLATERSSVALLTRDDDAQPRGEKSWQPTRGGGGRQGGPSRRAFRQH